jgi:hypothetical protein
MGKAGDLFVAKIPEEEIVLSLGTSCEFVYSGISSSCHHQIRQYFLLRNLVKSHKDKNCNKNAEKKNSDKEIFS